MAEEDIQKLDDFITLHHRYKKAIPCKGRLPAYVGKALDRILQEAIIEKTRWENNRNRED